MTRPRWIACAMTSVIMLAATQLPAQDAASTLLRLTEISDSIAIAETTGSGNHRATFQLRRPLRGTVPQRFVLSEPLGRACGRALHSLAAGRYLLFLSIVNGTPRLTSSSARCVVIADAMLVRHVESLLTDPAAATRTLLTGLDSNHPRVRDDAAISLLYRRDLETFGATASDRVVRALRRDLRSRTTPHLLRAAARLRASAAIAVLLPAYLSGRLEHMEALLLEQLPRLDQARLCQAIAARLPADGQGRARACRLLEQLPLAAAREPLERIFSDGQGALAVSAGRALRALGTSDSWLRQRSSAVVFAAIQQSPADRAPTFRSILRSQP